MRRAVFLDRDGVINEHRVDYVKSWNEFHFLPGVFEACRKLAALPFTLIVVTNQSAIGRGVVSSDIVEEIHRRMVTQIQSQGGRIDDIMYCPHRPDEDCACRKPKPGMLIEAAFREKLDLSASYFVGDSTSDVEAAAAAGCTPLLVLTGIGKAYQHQLPRQYPDLEIFPNLLGAVEWIMAKSRL